MKFSNMPTSARLSPLVRHLLANLPSPNPASIAWQHLLMLQ